MFKKSQIMMIENLGWLNKYGVDPSDLDRESQELASSLGSEGVSELVDNNRGTFLYRGNRITPEERVGNIERVQRFSEMGGKWSSGQKYIGDKPEDWILDEQKYLEGLVD